MPKPQRKRSALRSAALESAKSLTISDEARAEQHLVHVTRRLLHALQELDQLDQFRLAAVMFWMRAEWCGDSKVLIDTNTALELINVLTDRERRQAIALAAESNLRAAVTA